MYCPIFDLLIAAKNQKILVELENPDGQERNEKNNSGGKTHSSNFKFVEDSEIQKGETRRSTSATTLVRKLRSSTLGLQFDWSKRNYDVALSHNKIPDALATLAKKMAIPAMPSGEEFKPEAAIVNYYGPSDVLGGHVDDMEADWTKPIVSLSLGCKCIFLLGGKTRDEVPTAMFPQSGDIALMTGEARERFHGVPRIFTELCKHHLYMELAKLCMHHLHLELDLELSEKRSRRLLMIVLQLLLAFLNLWCCLLCPSYIIIIIDRLVSRPVLKIVLHLSHDGCGSWCIFLHLQSHRQDVA